MRSGATADVFRSSRRSSICWCSCSRTRGRLVTKDEIIERIWNGRIVSEAALSSRIKAVRQAIGDDGASQACIRTVRRRGFRVVAEVTRSGGDGGASPSSGRRCSKVCPGSDRRRHGCRAKPRHDQAPLVGRRPAQLAVARPSSPSCWRWARRIVRD